MYLKNNLHYYSYERRSYFQYKSILDFKII